jgi:glycosyltransferase involved in cell wall biosynthesis
VYPLLTGKRPYLGFEHGTLRDFTLANNSVSRVTALGYQQANHVFITNGDCLAYAERIKVPSYTAMIHPVDDERIRGIAGDYEGAHREFGAKYLFLCPIRHDWAVKGTDQYIRALPLIAERIGRDVRMITCRWGMQVDDSQALARSLGVEDLIAWVDPLNRGQLVRLQKSSDVVFDQIALPHFGATAPQALAAGVPVIMSYDPASTAWIIPEPAPILSAWTPEEIAAAVQLALDPEWRQSFGARAREWFEKYHSSAHAVDRSAAVYRQVCREAGIL